MSLQPMLALMQQDLRLAVRHGGESLMPLMFLFSVIILVPLGVGPGPNLLSAIAPGMIWVAALLSSLLALERLFRPDYEDGSLEQWWLGHLPAYGLVMTRLLSHWLITGVPIIVFAPVAAEMLYLPDAALGPLILSLLLGTPILSLVGGLAAALTLSTNRGSVLLSILIFPLIVPVLVFATGAVSVAAEGWSPRTQLGLLAAMLILAVTLIPLAITAALRLNIE
ncbi:heme exporter protein CcmB [Wenzhouxiangella marina]|uniref:Heme exporter protein B n=1 Tax=Wenzhouxiangella marina TaxID=1579979 RepID=A0A0K0XXZ5_9GAMM|nr:heme exporter protein CcmB [Wenzhouxiangella marina]AKS42502.1 heme ABC transporter permease [Wenzhouxiangella marina]MBB6085722.1 heme exporter protein B [Wenzhouxiangella marina]